MVGWVLVWSARSVVWPSQVWVVLVYRGLWAGGGGWWGVVVVVGVVLGVVVAVVAVVGLVLGVVVVVVGGVLVVVVLVVDVVMVVVLWVRPQDPVAFWWDVGVRHRLQPLEPHCLVDSGGKFRAGLSGDRGGGVPRPQVGPAGGDGGLWGMDGWAFGDGMCLMVWAGSCCVAASVMAVCAWGRGPWDVVGAGSWWWGRFWRCRPLCGCWRCVWWCWLCWWCGWCCGGRCCYWRWGSSCGFGSGFGFGTGLRW